MIPELSHSPFYDTEQGHNVMKTTLEYLHRKTYNLRPLFILDIGQRSPLTNVIDVDFGAYCYNTAGDLDTYFVIEEPDPRLPIPARFEYILYSHTIEHQFNPLHTLRWISMRMNRESRLFIILPRRGKLLWCKGHFHEIDDYRMRLLLRRAGMEVVSIEMHKVWRDWRFYLTGVRPLMRLLFEYNAYYEIKLSTK